MPAKKPTKAKQAPKTKQVPRTKQAPKTEQATKTKKPEKLATYRKKRDFDITPEPPPDVEPGPSDQPRFVVQEHHARAMHWDFRLERDGVLVSWAVPKGIPPDPSVNHLAVQTEDHPLSYIDFEGEIPKGEYGGGDVMLWDHGTYELSKWEPKEVIVTLHGQRVEGRYALIKTRDKQWLMHRMDPPQDAEREPFPEGLRPMLPTKGSLPKDDKAFGFEIAWGGTRAVVYGEGGRVRIEDEDGFDISDRYPELARLGRALSSHEAVLDGELVALDREDQPVPGPPPSRDGVQSDSARRRAARDHPVAIMLFDVLYVDGHMVTDRAYQERRTMLEDLRLSSAHWQTPSFHVGDGAALLDAARQRGLPGVVAKRLDGVYQPGETTKDWILVRA